MNSAAEAIASPAELARVIRRNTVLLGACLAVTWSVVQLQTALGAVALAVLLGQPALAGLSPAVSMVSWAAASLLMGRYMDAHGRVPGLRLAFGTAVVGAMLAWAGTAARQPLVFLLGIALVGGGEGAANLARAGAADMYPPRRRARGISLVLLGAAFGAILGPLAFAPLLSGVREDVAGLATPWLLAAGLLAGGGALTYAIRVDPVRIAEMARTSVGGQAAGLRGVDPLAGASSARPGRPLGEILRAGPVRSAVAAAVAAQAIMTSAMGVVGLILVGHGHDLAAVSVTVSAHFLGMFGLVLVVGQVVDRLGRVRAAVVGLLILGAGVLGLIGEDRLETIAPAMFALGLGWNLAFVAATALLADATEPHERARLLGLSDMVGVGMGAAGSAVAAGALGIVGVPPLAIAGAVLALLPAALIARRPATPQAA